MICKLGGFVIQCHKELRDLKAELLSTVCGDVETEPVLQDISGEQLSRRSNKAQDARLQGTTDDQHSLMSGSDTQMPNRIRISKRNRSIVCMRKRRNVCIQEEFSTLSMEYLRPWCLQQLVVRERIPKVSQSTSGADFHQERRTKC